MIAIIYLTLGGSNFERKLVTFEIFEIQTCTINVGKLAKTLTPWAYAVTGSIKLTQFPLLCGNNGLISASVFKLRM